MNPQSSAEPARAANARQPARHVLFLSHAGVDAEAALRLADRIEATPEAREHRLEVWLDKRDLEAGSGWQRQLERAIDEQSTAFAVYVGATGIINWVDSEVGVALSRARRDQNYRFIPIISASAEGSSALPPFARLYHGVLDVENRPEELAKLIRAAIGATARQPVRLVEQPFPGLRAFENDQAHLFFGRESEREELVEKLRREPLLMVVGDSGSGKSSLVRAGLVPRFRGGALADLTRDRPDDTVWHVVIARPRGRPFEALADAVFRSGEIAGIDAPKLGTCKDWIRTRQPAKVRDGLLHGAPRNAQILLVVDQLEELLTQAEEASRQPYVDALLGLVADPSDRSVRIVMTMRYDYYNLCSQFPAFFERLEGDHGRAKCPLERMRKEGLRACVQEPLKLAGLQDTGTLASEVVRDIGERPGNLALMQMALREAWQKRKQFGDDLLEAYISVGRVTGALANSANEVFENRLKDHERQLAEIAFIRLVRLGDTGGTTRRTAARDEFSDDAWAVVQKLATEECRRLLFIGGAPGKESVELAHEALATQWPRYQTWLQQAADDKRRLDRLIDRVERWQAAGTKVEDLVTGTEREDFQGLANARPSWLAPAERRFVEASGEAYQEEQDRKEKARRRELSLVASLKRAAIATAVVAIVAILAGAYALVQRDDALEARDLAKEQKAAAEAAQNETQLGDSLYRAEQAQAMLREGFPITAMQLALAGLPEGRAGLSGRPWVGEAAGALVEAMAAQREQRLVLDASRGGVKAAAFSPDGARIVSGFADGTVGVRAVVGAERPLVLYGHKSRVSAAAFSPDGMRIVSGSDDHTVRVWEASAMEKDPERQQARDYDAREARERAAAGAYRRVHEERVAREAAEEGMPPSDEARLVLSGHEGPVYAVAFSPDSARIVSGGADGIRLWQFDGSPASQAFKGHDGIVLSVAFSPDGDRIVSGGADGIRLWQLDGSPVGEPFRGHDGIVLSVAFSPDGDRIVSGGFDGTVRLWQPDGSPVGEPFKGHDGPVVSVAFSPESDRIVSGGFDGTVRLWQLDGTAADEPFKGHNDGVWSVAFSPGGDRIVSGGEDGTVRLWQLDRTAAVVRLKGPRGRVSSVALSPVDDRIVSGGADGIRLWQLDGSPVGEPFKGHVGVLCVASSPDGDRIVSGGVDGTVRVWQLDGSPVGEPFKAHDSGVFSIAFSPDGDLIVSGGVDGTVRLWQLDGSPAGEPFKAHGSGVLSVAFSPDGDRIVSVGVSPSHEGSVRLWQLDGSPAGEPPLNGLFFSVAFSPQGDRIVSRGLDGTVRVWEAASGAELLVLRSHKGDVPVVSFSRDGARIVSGSADGTVRVTWIGRSKQELIETARARLPRELTAEERRRFRLAVE